jgi:dihydrofolate reductase
MSLDGFIAAPNDEVDALFAWWGDKSAGGPELLDEAFKTTGAVIMGRRSFDIIDGPNGWVAPDGTAFPWPVFVLCHDAREKVTKGATKYTFVTDGIESALRKAKAAAGDKNVSLMGANTAQQYIKAGLVDEMQIHLVPILLGEGIRLFDHLGTEHIELQRIMVIESPGVTHLRFRVVK